MTDNLMDKIVSLSKRRGFIFPGSEIYGGLANTYDYGPVGAELLRNIRNLWWDNFVHKKTDIVGIDASLISSGLNTAEILVSSDLKNWISVGTFKSGSEQAYRADYPGADPC